MVTISSLRPKIITYVPSILQDDFAPGSTRVGKDNFVIGAGRKARIRSKGPEIHSLCILVLVSIDTVNIVIILLYDFQFSETRNRLREK